MSGCAAIGLALGGSTHCPELRPNPRPDETTGRPDSRAPRRRIYAVVASLLPAPLRKRRDDVIPRLLRRLVLTSGLASLAAGPSAAQGPRPASITDCQQREGAAGAPARRTSGVAEPLARREEPARLPGGRPSPLTARRSARPSRRASSHVSSHVSSRVSSGRANRPPGKRVRAPALGPAPAASEASPGVSTSLRRRRGMAPSRRFRSGAGSERSERPRSSCDVVPHCRVGLSSSWSWVRLHFPGSQRRAARPSPVSGWHRARRAMRRRRRVALVDGGEPLGRALVHGSRVSAR